MIDQKKSPASQRRQADGITGDIRDYTISVPVQLKRLRKKPDLVRFQGDYYTLDDLLSKLAGDALEAREGGV
jgi:hypothetical protein